MLRKTLFFGLIMMAALVLAAPALVGWQLARHYYDYVERLNVPGSVKVLSSQIDRGWFTSKSRIRLAPALCPSRPCPVLAVDSIIHHGPIPVTAPPSVENALQPAMGVVVSRIDPADLFPEVGFEPAPPTLEAITRVNLDGAANTRLRLPGTRLEVAFAQGGGRVASDGISGQIDIDAQRDGIDLRLEWPSFSVVGQRGGQLAWQALAIEFSGSRDAPMFWRDYRLGLGSLQAADREGQAVALQGLVASAEAADAKPGELAGRFDMRLSRLALRGEEYGPAIVEGKVSGLNLQAVAQLDEALQALRRQDLPPAQAIAGITAIYRSHLSRLLAARPELQISRFLLGTPEGDIIASLKASLPGDQRAPDSFVGLLQRLEGRFDLRMPAPLLRSLVALALRQRGLDNQTPPSEEEVSAAIQYAVDEGLLVSRPEEQVYVIQGQLSEGRLLMNGSPLERWDRILEGLRRSGA